MEAEPEKKMIKKKNKSWDEKEEITIIIEVLEREQTLFGELKGSGVKSIHRKRLDAWQEVADILNSRYVTAKRDVEEVKKKWQNVKQRCKEKIDRLRRAMGQTGGGPPPADLTPVELLFWERLCSRPSVRCLSGGVDTDAQDQDEVEPSTSATRQEDSTAETTEPVRELSECDRQARSKKGGGKRWSQQDLILENTEKDTERLELETRKLCKEIEVLEAKRAKLETETAKLKSERETWEVKKIYYQLKIQNDFGMNINFDQ